MGVFTVGRQVYLSIEMPENWWLANSAIDMDFINNRYRSSSGTVTAIDLISCSRASIGYAKTSAGTLTSFGTNTLRITDLGLLIEDARTNLTIFSQDFSTSWNSDGQAGTLTTDAIAAPDGTTTADQLADTNSGAMQYWSQNVGTSVAGKLTISIYAKAGTSSILWLVVNSPSLDTSAYFDLVNGTFVARSSTAAPDGMKIEAMANGWWRCSVTQTAGSVTCTLRVAPAARADMTGGDPINAPTGNLYVWGAQLEQAAFSSSYIPTSGASATRAAENITTSGSLQTVINAATASLVAQVDNGLVASVATNIVDSNGTNLLGFDASNHALASMIGTLATGNTANRTTQDKLGLAWDPSGRSLVLNGGTVATDASAQTPSATQHIGSSGTANFAYAYVERLSAWTTKLADATLQGFTV